MNIKLILSLIVVFSISIITAVVAQELDSTTYRIKDPTIDSGGEVVESTSYKQILSIGDPTAYDKLESTSYRLRSGFPEGSQANVPAVVCFETDTTSGTTSCVKATGMQEVCGTPGCYDRAKIEIDDQGNPYDTLYLVKVVDDANSTTYYLQSDHTLSTTYDINDFLDQCDLEGYDADEPTCDTGEGREDTSLQKYNVYSLRPGSSYTVSVSALHGDLTQTGFSATANATTENIQVTFDLDISATDSETSGPYSVDLGKLSASSTTTATESIWIDIGSNNFNGVNVYAEDLYDGLDNSGATIDSETEDIDGGGGSNGGFGLKTISVSETSLGPLLNTSTIYNTAGSNEVGRLQSSATNLILFTNTSGANLGQIEGGRSENEVKARSGSASISGDYSDTVTFTATLTP